jgi:hypothetical protein
MSNATQHLTDEDISEIASELADVTLDILPRLIETAIFGMVRKPYFLICLLTPQRITAVHTVLFICCAYYFL